MKKLLSIIVLGLLLSGNSYAESIKLNCTFREAYAEMVSGGFEKVTPEFEEYRFWSEDTVVTINEKLKTFEGSKAVIFNDEIIKNVFFDEVKGPKATEKSIKIWTINRITGIFRKEIYAKIVGRDLEFRPLLDITYDCKKAVKKF